MIGGEHGAIVREENEPIGWSGVKDSQSSAVRFSDTNYQLNMTKEEIAADLRNEVAELQELIRKLQLRCDEMKRFVLNLEEEIHGPTNREVVPDSKFRKAIDRVFGEKPKGRKH